jgi:hypothetical protein
MTIAALGRSPSRSARERSTLFRLASGENGAMQTAAARAGDVPQSEYAIRRRTDAYSVSCKCPGCRPSWRSFPEPVWTSVGMADFSLM